MTEIILTKDGSHSLLNTTINETYHSVHGAIQESVHVFIKNGFEFYNASANPHKISILEVGFGTGLNALLTLRQVLNGSQKVFYTTIEPFPLAAEIWSKLNYPLSLGMEEYFKNLHNAEWEEDISIHPNFQIRKLKTTLQGHDDLRNEFDIVYFDAFAPTKQPEMWKLPVLKKVIEKLKPSGILVTYCAKGQVKRDLRSLEMVVQTLQGPAGKKEMVRAVKTA